MLAIDNNIIVRYLTGDHPDQAATARQIVDGQDVLVAVTVMLESEWVLRSVYGFASAEVCQALRRFASLPRVSPESPVVSLKRLSELRPAWTLPMPCTWGRRRVARPSSPLIESSSGQRVRQASSRCGSHEDFVDYKLPTSVIAAVTPMLALLQQSDLPWTIWQQCC